MNQVIEVIKAIQAFIHHAKPLIFELVLFTWAIIEMGKFIWTVAIGGHGG